MGYARRREETARVPARRGRACRGGRGPRAHPPRAAAGGGARPGRGLTDEVGRVVGERDRLGML